MSPHLTVEVYKGDSGRWWWICWEDHPDVDEYGDYPTHAEALAAALAHCAKAGQR